MAGCLLLGGVGDRSLHAQAPPPESYGIYTMTFEPGYHALGFSLLNPAIAQATVGSVADLGGDRVGAQVEAAGLAPWLESHDGEIFLEVLAVPQGGEASLLAHRFEVDESATRAGLAGGVATTLVLESNSPWNTGGSAASLAGCLVEITPHRTLAQQLPPELLHPDFSFSKADQVQVFRDGSFETYFVLGEIGSFAEWRRVGGVSDGSMSHLVLHPGEGVYFVRSRKSPGAVELTFSGRVRQGGFVQPLVEGVNFIAEGHPYTRTFVERNALGGTFTGSFSFNQADQVQVPDGKNYDKYYLASDGGSYSEWFLFGGDNSPQSNAPVFDFRRAVFMERNLPDPHYRLEAPWLN